MKLKVITSYLDASVPLEFQEGYDNSGLQVGSPEAEINSVLISLDVTEEVINEAISLKCQLIISHHPLLFTGVKSLTGKSFTERILLKAVKCDIAIYSAHTNLDVFSRGVSWKMAEKIGLEDIRVLSPVQKSLLKLVTYVPASHLENVRDALFNAGAGAIGNYDKCGFSIEGEGSFKGNDHAKPFKGEKGKIHYEKEIRFETVLFSHLKDKVVENLLNSHPYEEVAYDLYSLENSTTEIGTGCFGKLPVQKSEEQLLELVSDVLEARGIRYSKPMGKPVEKVALCGGAGASLIKSAISAGADVFITSDIKYHDFLSTDNRILLIDAGHFETEKFSTEILKDLINKKFPKFAVRFSETNTNPINYF